MRNPQFCRTGVNFLRALGMGAAFVLPIGVAHASTQERLDLAQLVAQADLVFEGTVVGIDHKNSEVVEAGDAKLPHTFVTFAIEDIVKGTSDAGKTVTLRFLGGPDGTGRVLEVAGVPRFALGDRDLLFVRNEKSAICPVVGLEAGRFRLVRGEVFDALGNAVWMAPSGRFLAGEETIDLTKTGYPPRTQQSDAQADLERSNVDSSGPPAGSLRPDAAGLKQLLRLQSLAARIYNDAEIETAFHSARLADVLRFPRFRAVVPRASAGLGTDPAAKAASRKRVDRAADPDTKDDAP